MNGINVNEFAAQMRQYSSARLDWDMPIVIRTAEGDCSVAAVHVDDGQLVIDLGESRADVVIGS